MRETADEGNRRTDEQGMSNIEVPEQYLCPQIAQIHADYS